MARVSGRVAPDSRWWYWVAALPAAASLWLLAFLWVFVAVAAEFGDVLAGDPFDVALGLSVAIGGVPLLVIGLLVPVAVFFDSRALRRAGFEWPRPLAYAALVALCLPLVPLGVAVAAHYVYRRRQRVGVP